MAKFREGNLYIKDDKLLIGTASWALNAQAGEGNFSGSFSGSFFGDLIGDVIANDIYISESLIVTDITASGDIYASGEISSSGNIYTEADLIVTDITSSGDIIINGQIYAANIESAESNIVFVSSSNGQFKTDEINPIVWDTDATFISSSDGLDNRVAVYTSPSGIEGDAKFTWNGSTLSILGKLEATQKSFVIKNPSKTEGKLEYGSLESPYHGIRLTGEDTTNKLGYCEINLPYYVKDLVNTDQINIQLTNINNFKIFTVSEINIDDNKFIIKVKRNLIDLLFRRTFKFYWDLTAERKDIEKLKVEI